VGELFIKEPIYFGSDFFPFITQMQTVLERSYQPKLTFKKPFIGYPLTFGLNLKKGVFLA